MDAFKTYVIPREELIEKLREAAKRHVFVSPIQNGEVTVTLPAPQPGILVIVKDHAGVIVHAVGEPEVTPDAIVEK